MLPLLIKYSIKGSLGKIVCCYHRRSHLDGQMTYHWVDEGSLTPVRYEMSTVGDAP